MINRILLAFFILHSSFLIGVAQPITPPIPSTPFTRTFLRATNAEAAVAALGMTGVTLTNYAGTAASATNAQYLTGYTADAERYLIFTNEQGTAGISYNDLTGYFEFNALKTVKASAFEGDGSGLSGVKAATAVDATNLASATWGGISNSASGATNVVVANNAISLQAGSANTLAVTGGKVGIGTTNPGVKLDVIGGTIRTDGASSGIAVGARDGSGTQFEIYNPTGDDVRFFLGADKVTIRAATGRVGIGTTNPATLLDVAGTTTTSNLIVGTTYPTLLTSDSTGLVTDQPLTVGGVTPSVTIGSGGPSITASGKTLTISTNVSIGTNTAKLEYGSASTLVVSNGSVGLGKVPSGTYSLESASSISVAGGIVARNLSAANGLAVIRYNTSWGGSASDSGSGIEFRTAPDTGAVGRMRLDSAGVLLVTNQIQAGSMVVSNTLTASNIVSAASVTSTNFGFYLINGTSSNSVAGMLVEINPLTNFAYQACAASSQTPVGVVLDSGVAPGGSVRIADRGIVQVLVDSATTTNWPGAWFGSSATTAGRAVILTDPPSAGVHDREIGHGLQAAAFAASDATTNLQYVLLHIGR